MSQASSTLKCFPSTKLYLDNCTQFSIESSTPATIQQSTISPRVHSLDALIARSQSAESSEDMRQLCKQMKRLRTTLKNNCQQQLNCLREVIEENKILQSNDAVYQTLRKVSIEYCKETMKHYQNISNGMIDAKPVALYCDENKENIPPGKMIEISSLLEKQTTKEVDEFPSTQTLFGDEDVEAMSKKMTTLSQLSMEASSNMMSKDSDDDDYAWMCDIDNSQDGIMVGRSVVEDMEVDSDDDYAWMLEIQNSLEGKMVGPIVDGNDDDDDDDGDNEQWFLEEEWEQIGGGETVAAADVPGPSHTVVSEKYKQEVKRFRTTGTAYDVRFENLDEVEDIQALAKDTIQRQIDEARKNGQPGDLLGIEINHPALKTPVLIPFRNQEEQDADKEMHTIELVAQSKKDFKIDDGFLMKFTHVQLPQGSGAERVFRGNFEEWLEKKANGHGSCFVKIDNDDNLCLARSLVTARAHVHRGEDPRTYKNVRQGDNDRRTIQKRLAKELMSEAGLADHQGSCGLPEIKKLQQVMPDYQIKIWSKDKYNAIWFEGHKKPLVLHLYHYNNHYIVISSISGFHEKSYWCEDCNKGYGSRQKHLCPIKCSGCLNAPPCNLVSWIPCTDCGRFFYNNKCFDNHRRNSPMQEARKGAKVRKIQSVCDILKLCKTCGKMLDKDHKCGMRRCAVCNKMVPSGNHQCYIEPLGPPKDKKKVPTFIFFDFETTQSMKVKENDYGSVYKHEVNCCIRWKVCDKCWKNPEAECSNCGNDKVKEFLGEDCLEKFCKYLFTVQNKGCTAIAHNGRGFDHQFILNYIHEQGRKPTIISRGLEIMMLEFEDIRLIDSLNFLHFALAAMPKAFDLPSAKGYFPHFFNILEHWDYEGDLPEAYFYGPGQMKKKQSDVFYKWYNQELKDMRETGRKFKFMKSLIEYCKTDVLVLLQASMKFREIFMNETSGVDPLMESITIASACNKVFRRNYLKPDMIGIVPDGGYRKEEKQSIFALKYIKYVSERTNLAADGEFLQHAGNGGEMKIGPYKVDAALKTLNGVDLKEVFEVNGCYYHGCTKCFKDRKRILVGGFTAEELFQRTLKKARYLKEQGYKVNEVWECEVNERMRKEPEMKDFFQKDPIQDPINARDAFFGGRTNATQLYKKCKHGQKISYLDVCSLYPWVCKLGMFPCGHPTILTENFEEVTADNQPYKGIMKCKVLPPRGLLHPVLPHRSKNKLTFPLCAICADERNQQVCQHNDEERSFWGTWVTLELYKALECGYKIVEIAEVWHYTKWAQYIPGQEGAIGLFTEYINAFLKLKQQASGWPGWVKTEEDKVQYIQQYEEREGIKLDADKIEYNGSLRQLAKLCLNSFWGKFGQRNNMAKMEYFDNPAEYFEVVCDETNAVSSIRIVNPEMVAVTYNKSEQFSEALPNTSSVIAAYVSTQARLKLLSYIEKLQERVLYFDTDSVVFVTNPGDTYQPPTGDFLGDMTDELSGYGSGSYITEFISGGPKQYGMKIWSTKDEKYDYIVKLRGFTINSTTANVLNYKNLRSLVKTLIRSGYREELNVVIQRIERNADREVFTTMMKKTYKSVYDKRRLMPNGDTRPYGY